MRADGSQEPRDGGSGVLMTPSQEDKGRDQSTAQEGSPRAEALTRGALDFGGRTRASELALQGDGQSNKHLASFSSLPVICSQGSTG